MMVNRALIIAVEKVYRDSEAGQNGKLGYSGFTAWGRI